MRSRATKTLPVAVLLAGLLVSSAAEAHIPDRPLRAWHFVPFGVGQIYNGDYSAGVALAFLQTAAFATSSFTYFGLTSFLREPRVPDGTCQFPTISSCPFRNGNTALAYRSINYLSFSVGMASAALGILHAVLTRRERTVRGWVGASSVASIRTPDLVPSPPASAEAPPAIPRLSTNGSALLEPAAGFHLSASTVVSLRSGVDTAP